MNKQLLTLIAIIGMTCVLTVKQEDCTVITCSEDEVATDMGVCMTSTSITGGSGKNISFKQCRDGYYCFNATPVLQEEDVALTSVACIKDPYDSSLFDDIKDAVEDLVSTDYCPLQAPGESCSNASHCESGKCTSSKCEGNKVGTECSSNIDCDVGLFCSSNKCAKQMPDNSNCTNQYECANTHGCFGGKCVKYYSLANNAEATNPLVCVNGTIRIDGSKTICDSLTLDKEECTGTSDKCTYKYATNAAILESSCQCDATRKTNTRSCGPANPAKYTINETRHTTLRFTAGTCNPNTHAGVDSCLGRSVYGNAFDSSSFLNYGLFFLIAVLATMF